MGRRALTAQEKAERQRQRQEALHAKQTLRLVREHALDPHLRVIVDRALPISSASQTIAATVDRPYANEDHSPVDPPARERHATSTSSELPSRPGPSTVQRDEGSHSSPLIAKLSALDIRGDASTRPNAATHGPTDLRPVPVLPPILQNDEHDHSHYDAQNPPFDVDTEVSISEDCSAAKSVNPVLSSSSPMHRYEYPVSELASPSSQRPNARAWFTSSSAPSATDPHGPVLDGFLRSIDWQETSESADFLRIQSGVYEKVFRSFFARECECPRSCKIAEPEHAHTLQERTEYIQRSLPPLHSVFDDLGAQTHNPHGSFSRWESFLSDQPSEPLSFRKTQASLTPESVTITRQWDVDSIWFGAKTLSAIRPPNQFRLSFFPSHKSNISTNQIIQPHGLDLAHTRHTSIGSFSTGNVRFNVIVFFPNGSRSPAPASMNSLSLERFRDLYDDIIIPAAYETLPDHAQQEIPSSYDLIYAKSRAYQENPGAGRWVADDESRTFRLAYSVPAEFLSRFWASVVQKANLHRIETRRGETVAYYQNPRLLFQAHDLKNVFARPNLQESLVLFRDNILAGLDPEQLALQSCWLDVGMRDHVSRQRHGQTPSQNDQQSHHEPWTLLWKSACCRHLHRRLSAIAPEAPLDAKYYRSSLLRDAGIYYAKAKSTKSSDPGHPEFKSPGIIRAKAYNCKKELFGVMFNDYKLFNSGSLPLLAFDEGMFNYLAGMNQNRQCAFTPQLSRSHIKRAWEANKRHLRAISSARRYPNFGIRKEVTSRLDVILAMLADGAFQPDQATHTGPMVQEIMLDPTSDTQHYPFWIVPTRMINDFVSTQAARFILPLDDIFQEATSKAAERYSSSSSLNPVRQILAFYTAQLFCRLLIYALSDEDEEQHFDNWIWKSVWSVRLRGREKAVSERRGLGLGSLIDSTGMLWIPQSHIDWQHGHLSLEVLIHLYMARSPLQARLAHQPNVQVLTSTHIVVERLFQEWLRNAQLSHDTNCPEKADEYANKAIALAVEETARAYYQHFLAKLASYWDRVRDQIGRQILPALSCLQRARDESAADTARILSAQTLRKIYCEAWAEYSRATSASGHLLGQGTECDMPDELPCWMATRQRLPPKDSWSDFVYGVLFYHPNTQPKWSRLYFLQLYRSFRDQWDRVKLWAGQFDTQFGIRIGHYIRVMFNTDRSKEVGTAHGEGTWYHGWPPFFQIQFWAPYFSPPQSQKDIPLASVYQRHQYPDGLSPSAMSTIPTARDFQALDELVWEHWIQIVDNIDSLRSASHSYIRRHCRQALLYVRSLSGPTWGSNGDVKFVQPWSVERKDIDECEEEDVFRIPVVYNHIPKHMSESIINQPTIFLPDRDNVMGLLKNIESLPGHSASFIARLGWAMRELDNDGDQYDVRSRLVAKQQALDPTSQSQTLLEQFLRQTEPPEKKALSPDAVDVLVIIEREEGEEEEEEGAEREAEDDEDDNDEGRAHRGDDIISYSDGISRSLAPLPAILTERDKACDPRASFPQWRSFLSDRPTEPLSLHKTQASLPHGSVTVARRWDVDSIWFGAKSLSAIRAPSHFRLSFFPAYKSNISTAQVIQPHGLDLAHTRHTSIGTFTTAGVRFSVLLFFPNGARSRTKASANSLSLARFKDLYDEIILPAIFETVPDHVQQEIPSSYDLLYAKSRAYQEKPGAGRWSAEDESRAFRLSYSIPARNLADFWASVVEKANMHRVQTRRGDAVPYFGNPRLLFQAHDLKNTFASQTLGGSLALFRDIVLAGLDANQIDMHSCWLDVGMRDHVRQPSSQSPNRHGGDPWTLLWKSACCEHLHDQLGGIVPEASLVADQYRSYLLRDVGTYYAKAKASRASNPGHPEARAPGIIRVKAYNCSKDLFGVMFSDYQLFSSGLLPLLAFDEAMLKDLAATDQTRQRAFASQLHRSHLVDAWEANKRHMRAIATLKRYPNFGIRKEVTLCQILGRIVCYSSSSVPLSVR
ncbi:hypothetical protein FOVG_19070 [Fusarium oxysporum f. sp. pisi HDV247]|uniref:Uncharacterized protein n=1 Tax=Fusarium oxysporum f. sp. pisi HDV247 TaxID=1080344 RepID=W9NNM3_FUSOX|nr:hypothetical protein FOVG_19070 [Fusarium oxysporum f. sp. pisi HDV247]